MINYGEALKRQRMNRGISQKMLAELLKLNSSCISLWDNNRRIPNVEQCRKLADFYRIRLEELIGRR